MDMAKAHKGHIYVQETTHRGVSSFPDEARDIRFRRATNTDYHPVNPDD